MLIQGLEFSITCNYRIRAYNDRRKFGLSNEAKATSGGKPFSTILNLLKAVAASYSQINLTWVDTPINSRVGLRLSESGGGQLGKGEI